MEADTIGNKDYIAIVASKEELKYSDLNSAISRSSQPTYAAKVNKALQSILRRSASFSNTSDRRIYFKVDANDYKAAATILALIKNKNKD